MDTVVKKRSWVHILLRTVLIIVGIPIVGILLLIALLYAPPVQNAVVEKASSEIGEKTGYDIEIGSVYLAFPLKLKIADYRMSKNDTTYVLGERFDANISLLPLFTGKVEVNYISLEQLEIDTRDMLESVAVEGKVGYARVVVRDADIAQSVANIRQLHIADTDLNITLADTASSEESAPLEWIIKLHKGYIKNSHIDITMPHDTLSAKVYIEKILFGRGKIDLKTESFALKRLALMNCSVQYDRGSSSAEQAPLDHITLNDIEVRANTLRFASINDISANLTQLTFEQPGGIAIADAAAHLTSRNDTLLLHNLNIDSRNGSRVRAQAIIPHKALNNPKEERLTAELFAELYKPDLTGFVTPQVYNGLHYFNNRLLNANIRISGNAQRIGVETIALDFPNVGALNAEGYIGEILDSTRINGEITFAAEIDDIKKIIGKNDSIKCRTEAKGLVLYDNGKIGADIRLINANGDIKATGNYVIADTAYDAHISVDKLALSEIIPDIPLHNLKMNMDVAGIGIDIFSDLMQYTVNATIDTLRYDKYNLYAIDAKAEQRDCVSRIEIDGHDKNLLVGIDATTSLARKGIANHTNIELANADFKEIGLVDSTLRLSTNIDIAATTDFMESHTLNIESNGTNITTKQNSFSPDKLSLDFATTPAKTTICMINGDLDIDGEMDCGYNGLFAAFREIAIMNRNVMSGASNLYHLHDYEEVLPRISLDFTCGEKNMLHNFLAFTGIETKGIEIEADISKERGLNIRGNVSRFGSAGIELDSIRFATRQEEDKFSYIVGANDISVAALNGDNSYNALLHGTVICDTVTANFLLRDNIRNIDSKAGLTAHLSPGIINIHLNPEALVFGAPFAFNKENYINIGKAMSIDADVTFTGNGDSGFHLYTTPDESAKYNANLDIFNIRLAELASVLPGELNIGGTLFAQLNYRQGNNGDTFTGNADIENLTYNDDSIGNEKIELVYSPKSDDVHEINCIVSHNSNEVAHVRSDYRRGVLDGNISLNRLPLALTQAVIDKDGMMIDGYINSSIDFTGTLTEMKSNGYLNFDSVYAYSPMLGAMLHPAEDLIMIDNSKVNLQKFHIYDKANTPFVINGTVDINNLLNPNLNLRLNATNYEILNAPQKAGNMVYGKMYIDLRSMIRGTLDNIRLMGDLSVLSNSNFAYVLPETAFDSNRELDGLVEFVDFNDTTTVVQQEQPKIDLGDITATLNVAIQKGAKLSIDIDSSRENYVSIEGDGTLSATYDNNSGFNLTGIYELSGGQVKLTLPIIPLKTFYIQEGGRLTWTGDLFNPTLDVTAMEKTTVSVEMDDNSIQPVVFNAGVVVRNSVNDLAVDFTMSSPENSVIQSQLNELDSETLSRYAVAMIITGTYLGGRQEITAASALSSFLDAKINEISGNAIKNFDVNFGINDAMNAETGNAYTNYSFSFSKRFLNDRITIVIGGEVNSGDRPDKSTGNNSFINNISLEWRLNDAGNRYIRIFYDKNYQSLLEGEIIETGVGYVYKRKLSSLKELFIFKKKEKAKNRPDETKRKEQ